MDFVVQSFRKLALQADTQTHTQKDATEYTNTQHSVVQVTKHIQYCLVWLPVASLGVGGGWQPPGGDTRPKINFCGWI